MTEELPAPWNPWTVVHMGTPMGLMGPSPWLGSLSHFESISHHALSVRIRGGGTSSTAATGRCPFRVPGGRKVRRSVPSYWSHTPTPIAHVNRICAPKST